MNRMGIVGITLIAAITAASVVRADTVFTYQGELNENGNLANGVYNMDFSLWDAVAGGNQVGSTFTINDVQVTEGRFTVELDFGAAALENTDRWLEVAVNATTLAPRQPITRVPYAIQTRGLFVDDLNHIGIGVTDPSVLLHVESAEQFTAAFINSFNGGNCVFAASDSDFGFGIYSSVTGFNSQAIRGDSCFGSGVIGFHSEETGEAPAIFGSTLSLSDNAVGVYGRVASPTAGSSSAAVRGENCGTGVSGIGVWGSQDGDGYGVFGNSPTGIGVFGYSTGMSAGAFNVGVRGQSDYDFGIGVEGVTAGTNAVGVLGRATATTGFFATGVIGRTDTPLGNGVIGENMSTIGSGVGVQGKSDSVGGFDFLAAGVGGDYGSTSSRRWKRDIKPIDKPLEKIVRLRGVYYDWDLEHGGHHDEAVNALRLEKNLQIESLQQENNQLHARLDPLCQYR